MSRPCVMLNITTGFVQSKKLCNKSNKLSINNAVVIPFQDIRKQGDLYLMSQFLIHGENGVR